MPKDDESRTWHVHDHGSWGWGVRCEGCPSLPLGGVKGDKVVHFNLRHLKQQNQEGWTIREAQKKIEGDAKASGREIEKVR